MASSSSDLSASTNSNEEITWNGPDLCVWEPITPGCLQERTCSACLNEPVPDHSIGCFLEVDAGECHPFDQLELSPEVAAQINASITNAELYALLETVGIFSSLNRTYCDASDAACELCDALANNVSYVVTDTQGQNMTANEEVCFGKGGCVCAKACESAQWIAQTIGHCAGGQQVSEDEDATIIGVLLLLIIGIFLAGVTVWRSYTRRSTSPDRLQAQNNRDPNDQTQRLELTGWLMWRQEMRHPNSVIRDLFEGLSTPKLTRVAARASANGNANASASSSARSTTTDNGERPHLVCL